MQLASCAIFFYTKIMRRNEILLFLALPVAVVIALVGMFVFLNSYDKNHVDRYALCREAGGVPVSGNAWLWDTRRKQVPVCLNPSALIEFKDD